MADSVTISSGELTASISFLGAELQSLKDLGGRELMTNADPAYWSGRAPLLFPIVGRLNDDVLCVNGSKYAMQKHGFARKSLFDLLQASADEARFRLIDSTQSREQYPFAFELDAHFRVQGASLHQTVTVSNIGGTDMPFSFGFHPAFAWPLPFGGARGHHLIRFDEDEPAALARVAPYGTISPHAVPTPVSGRSFHLHDQLFDDDALVWRDINSRRVKYGAPGFPSLDIYFPDTSMLGIWTKPKAAFICIEPWAGIADPEGFSGDFTEKPGVMLLPVGEARGFRMDITLRQ